MQRDIRLTGRERGQIDRPEAPPGFELNHGWKVGDQSPLILADIKSDSSLVGNTIHLVIQLGRNDICTIETPFWVLLGRGSTIQYK